MGEDKLTVERARKIQRFMSQPFQVAEIFTGIQGRLVSLKDTITSFKEIIAGQHDSLPESAFYMVGSIEDVKAKAADLAKVVTVHHRSPPSFPHLARRRPTPVIRIKRCSLVVS